MDPIYLHYFTDNSEFPFFIQYGHHDTDLNLHFHADFAELVIVLSGTAMHTVGILDTSVSNDACGYSSKDEESYFIKKGDVFVIGEGVVHGYKDPHNL